MATLGSTCIMVVILKDQLAMWIVVQELLRKGWNPASVPLDQMTRAANEVCAAMTYEEMMAAWKKWRH